jgi:hypothetical protein
MELIMKKHGAYVIVTTIQNTLLLNVYEDSAPLLNFSVIPKRINNNTLMFSINKVEKYDTDTCAMDFLTMIGLLYRIANINMAIFDRLTMYQPNDNILFGIDMENAPRAFDSNDTFIDALLMENILTDDSDDEDRSNVNIDIIKIIDEHITFDINGMQCIHDAFLPEEDLHIYFKN